MSLLKKFKKLIKRRHPSANASLPCYVNGEGYDLPFDEINNNALKVIYRLNDAGFEAYLVGGGVRDLILGKHPKDFDVATNAKPEEIRKLFRNCRLIGRRFRLAHIYFYDEIIEVSTFRSNEEPDEQHLDDAGMVLRDNVYGTLEQDAWRRDFTINALYYDPSADAIIDYTKGLADLKAKKLRIIGDPATRYREDPIRMMRAIRFAAKLEFDIEKATQAAFLELHSLLWNVSSARLFEEVQKLFFTGHALAAYHELIKNEFLPIIFPMLSDYQHHPEYTKMLDVALNSTDDRLAQGKSVNPAFLLAALLWFPFQEKLKTCKRDEMTPFAVWQLAMQLTIQEQLKTLAIPKRFTQTMKDIWELQYRLKRRAGKRAFQALEDKRFRAGYDFLLLRTAIEPNEQALADWWTEFQKVPFKQQQEMVQGLERPRSKRTPKE